MQHHRRSLLCALSGTSIGAYPMQSLMKSRGEFSIESNPCPTVMLTDVRGMHEATALVKGVF